jgi:hypothetical protein
VKNILAKAGSIASGKEGEGIDFLQVLATGGGVIGVIFIVFGILRYVFHLL